MRSGFKPGLVSVLFMALSCVLSPAAQFFSDFNSGVPAGTVAVGTPPATVDASGGIGNSGVLKLTDNGTGRQGTFYVNDFAGGAAVTNFRAAFRLAIGGGTSRPADGMGFAFGTDIGGGSFGEEGAGTGINVTFDTW